MWVQVSLIKGFRLLDKPMHRSGSAYLQNKTFPECFALRYGVWPLSNRVTRNVSRGTLNDRILNS